MLCFPVIVLIISVSEKKLGGPHAIPVLCGPLSVLKIISLCGREWW